MNYEEMEDQFMDWEIEHGKEEAILIAAEEWGWSTYRVEKLVEKWENRLWQ
tara:strand:+ start:181 stop:333 length:153 start_codon:yes stop_codon:yes gene_type:complete